MIDKILKITDQSGEPFLAKKVAIINGASSEIGQAIATLLLENGATVAATYNKNKTLVDRLIETYGSKRVLEVKIDFLSEELESNIEAIVTQTKAEFGRINILINVSGVWLMVPFLHEGKKEVVEIWRINYWAPYYFLRKTLPYLMQYGGDVINIASMSGTKGAGQQATYSATKAALINLTQSTAEEFAPHGIKINAISPGPTDTSALNRYLDRSMKELLTKHIPIGALCKPEDVATAVLCVLMNNYITGVNIALHGGRA